MPSKRILAPHKEQNGYVYVRLHREGNRLMRSRFRPTTVNNVFAPLAQMVLPMPVDYPDTSPDQRVISSRRVEEAVEIADYLARCGDDGAFALCYPDGTWDVWNLDATTKRHPTLREAYWRWRNGERLPQ